MEGLPPEALKKALLDAGASETAARSGRAITYTDLYQWGLSGTAGSQEQRFAFLRRLGLPPRLSKKALCQVLNQLYTYEEAQELAEQTEE